VRGGFTPLEPGAGWSEFREIWAGSREKPDCVIFSDDVLFQDAIPAILASGVHIPDELEVVVFSNRGTDLPRPFSYTRMDCDPCELAEAMGGALVKLMGGEILESPVLTIPYRVALAKENDVNEVMNGVVKEAL
jgi:DNA-binding LacI/PurR family transcriptional regulator